MIKTLTGTNSFLLKQALDEYIHSFKHEHGDLAIERLDGEDMTYDQAQGSVESQPFLAARKLVVLRSPGAHKTFAEQFEMWLERIAETTDVIIIEPKVDKRSSYYKLLKKHTELLDFTELDAQALPDWLVEQAKTQGATLSRSDARYLVDRVGPHQQLLSRELEKLALFHPVITRETIDELTELTPQSTVFQLLDAAFAGNLKRALELYEEQRAQQVEPLKVLSMLAWQLHILAIVKMAGQRSVADIARDAKLNPFVVQKTQAIARKVSVQEVKTLVRYAADLDVRLKSTNIDADDALRQLIIDITELT